MKKYLKNNTLKNFALWNPEDLGYLAAYAAAGSPRATSRARSARRSRPASSAATRSSRAPGGPEVVLGPPFLFTKQNVDKFKF